VQIGVCRVALFSQSRRSATPRLSAAPSKTVIARRRCHLAPPPRRHFGRVASIIQLMTGASPRVSRQSLVVSLMVARNTQSASRLRFEHLTLDPRRRAGRHTSSKRSPAVWKLAGLQVPNNTKTPRPITTPNTALDVPGQGAVAYPEFHFAGTNLTKV